MCVSLERVGMMPEKDSVLKFICTEYRCCLVTSHEHNLLPFSTPQSYALLSAESKATEAANNKERLGECHDCVVPYHVFGDQSAHRVDLGKPRPQTSDFT